MAFLWGGRRFAALCLLSGLGACVGDTGRQPVARMSISPRYVPAGVESVVLLDGRRSCDEIDFPETCDKTAEGETGPRLTCPGGVSFRWSLDYPAEPVGGEQALTQPFLEVRLTPDRPVTVTLQVTDCDANTAITRSQIGIILPFP
ncbi:MAG: hypothetical protein RBU30_26525 [Polyangia bacterium]|jgi:hypothetical protein|nr:hypothetical protein [Polyangia bacterium]